jgi:hypothetical protein
MCRHLLKASCLLHATALRPPFGPWHDLCISELRHILCHALQAYVRVRADQSGLLLLESAANPPVLMRLLYISPSDGNGHQTCAAACQMAQYMSLLL